MTTLTISHTENANHQPFLSAWTERLRRRREYKALLDQPDYILKDIGVERHDILREASKPFWIA